MLRFSQTPGGCFYTLARKKTLHPEEYALQQWEPVIFITGKYFFAAYNDPESFL
jgi:hypothetical protein